MAGSLGANFVSRTAHDVFLDGAGTVAVNPLTSAAIRALMNAGHAAKGHLGGWHADENGQPLYRHFGKRAGEIRIRIDAADEPDIGADGWEILEGVSPFTLDVTLALLAQLCDPRTRDRTKWPMSYPAAVSASRILRYKGITRWGNDRDELFQRIDEEIRRLHTLRFDLIGFPAWDSSVSRWNQAGVSVNGVRLIEAVESDSASARDRVWLVRLGPWTEWWLNSQAKVWTGPLPKALIEFDHRKNRGTEVLAKKIGIDAQMLWCAIRSRAHIERRVESLLEDIGELPPPESRNAHWAGRLRDRFDEALLSLKERGLVDNVVWSDRFAPGSCDRNKGWVEPWLASKITLVRPADLFGPVDEKRVRKTVNRRRRAAQATAPGAGDLRHARLRLGLSQISVAQALGVSASYLSQMETGKMPLSDRVMGDASAYFSRMGPQ
jgi:hypothetical protein